MRLEIEITPEPEGRRAAAEAFADLTSHIFRALGEGETSGSFTTSKTLHRFGASGDEAETITRKVKWGILA